VDEDVEAIEGPDSMVENARTVTGVEKTEDRNETNMGLDNATRKAEAETTNTRI